MNDLVACPEQNNAVTNQTPIEIALKMDANGRVSAKNLYDFLELEPSNYSRWCKRKMLDNPWAVENVDYFPFVMEDERTVDGFQPNPTKNYLLSSEFAKKIAINSLSAKGEMARDYFQKCEQALTVSVKQINELLSTYKTLQQNYLELSQSHQELLTKVDDHNARLALIDGGSKFTSSYQEKWVNDTFEKVKKLAPVYTGGDYKACIGALIDDSRKWLDESYNEYARAYKLKHPEDVNPFRLRVISEFDEFRDAIDNAIYEQMRRFDMIDPPKNSSALDAFYANNVIDAASDF